MLESKNIMSFIEKLIELQILEREVPVTEENPLIYIFPYYKTVFAEISKGIFLCIQISRGIVRISSISGIRA